MATPIADKLRIKSNNVLLTLNAPTDFKKNLGALPAGVKIIPGGDGYNQVHWFVMNRTQMEKELPRVLKLVNDDVICWTYYPKGTSKLQTDLTRDKGWEALLKHEDLAWISLISFDDTWSTFAFRKKTEADRKKESKPKTREIWNYVNPQTKDVRLPAGLPELFAKNKKAEKFFHELSFTNKKEYIEWIVTAKRAETKQERLIETIERLNKGWKNPRNM